MAEYKDSISLAASSQRSSSSSLRAKAAAKKAELMCRQQQLKSRREMEDKHLALRQAREREELQMNREAEEFDLLAEV